MRIDIHLSADPELLHALRESHRPILEALHHLRNELMASLTQLQAAVAAEDTVIDSAVTLIQGLAQQIADLKPTQDAIDALAADVQGKADALAAAVAAGTPAAP